MNWTRTHRDTLTSGDYRITRARFPDSCWYYLWRGPGLLGTHPSAEEAKRAAEKDRGRAHGE